jgi:hypoxanthine phosphoribosyltransferase
MRIGDDYKIKRCFFLLFKRKKIDGKIVSMNLVGSVKGKNVIIIDDIVDTAVIFIFINSFRTHYARRLMQLYISMGQIGYLPSEHMAFLVEMHLKIYKTLYWKNL